MDKLLIAVQSDLFAQFLAKEFQSEYQICTCCDGYEALELLSAFRPHAMILNLSLPRKDGITILTQSSYIPPVILGIAEHSDPYGFSTAQRLGVGHILICPTVNTVAVTLSRMRLDLGEQASPALEKQILLLLHSLGFAANHNGFSMLNIAIRLWATDPSRQLSHDIYDEIAQEFNCSESSVEASIRRCIKNAWLKRENVVWSKLFTIDSNAPRCPNNSLFMKCLAQQINL